MGRQGHPKQKKARTFDNSFLLPTPPPNPVLLPFRSFSSSAPLLSSSLVSLTVSGLGSPLSPAQGLRTKKSPALTSLHPTFLITGLTAKVSQYMSIWREGSLQALFFSPLWEPKQLNFPGFPSTFSTSLGPLAIGGSGFSAPGPSSCITPGQAPRSLTKPCFQNNPSE